MIARITGYQVSPEQLDESIKNFQGKVIPAVKQQKGYRNGYLLIDRKTGRSITIAFWDTEEEAIADERSGHYQERLNTGKAHFQSPPVREIYEVAAWD